MSTSCQVLLALILHVFNVLCVVTLVLRAFNVPYTTCSGREVNRGSKRYAYSLYYASTCTTCSSTSTISTYTTRIVQVLLVLLVLRVH
jgi:hypothetical protein